MIDDIVAAEDVTPEWLTHALRAKNWIDPLAQVTSVTHERFGTGQSGASVRFSIDYASGPQGPLSLVAKFASDSEDATAFAAAAGMYEREVLFYGQLSAEIPVRAPRALHASLGSDGRRFAIVMEDLGPARIVDQLVGCSVDEAAVAMEQAAALHAGSWCKADLQSAAWLDGTRIATGQIADALPGFMESYRERYGASFGDHAMAIADTMVAYRGAWVANAARSICLWHQDFRCDNMLFDAKGGAVPLAVVDWQTIGMGPGMSDVAYFMGTSLPVEARRQNEAALIRHYHQCLVAGGVAQYDFDDCWRDYRRNAAQAVFTVIHASVRAARSDRGDEMWRLWAQRSAAHAEDLDCFAALSDEALVS